MSLKCLSLDKVMSLSFYFRNQIYVLITFLNQLKSMVSVRVGVEVDFKIVYSLLFVSYCSDFRVVECKICLSTHIS